MGKTLPGSCFCGAVTFTLELPTKWVAHCHCSMCRRTHGAPYVTWASVPTERMTLTAGAENLVRFASSKEARRSFCKTCGSTLFFESEKWPGEVHVARANIDAELDPPMAHAYWSSRASWVQVSDELPKKG